MFGISVVFARVRACVCVRALVLVYVSLCEGILRAPCLVMSNSLHEIGYWLSWRFAQQMHGRTINLMQKAAGGVDANWVLQSEWLDVSTVRRTAETMIDPFVWKWRSRYPPPES